MAQKERVIKGKYHACLLYTLLAFRCGLGAARPVTVTIEVLTVVEISSVSGVLRFLMFEMIHDSAIRSQGCSKWVPLCNRPSCLLYETSDPL